MTTDQGEARGMNEPGGAVRPKVSGGAEGRRSQGGADRSTGRGRVTRSAAGGRARGPGRTNSDDDTEDSWLGWSSGNDENRGDEHTLLQEGTNSCYL